MRGEEQDDHPLPSSWHSKVAVSSAVKVKLPSPVVMVPLGPPVIVTTGAVVSTVQDQVAGLGSVLPAVSVACTANVCAPALTVNAVPDVHAANVPPSREHWNVEPALSLEKANTVEVAFVNAAGLVVMVVLGGVPSTVQVRVAAAPTLPAASVATTETVWLPSASEETAYEDRHVVARAPSREQVVVADSFTVNVTVPERLEVTPLGPPVIVTTGAVVSTVHDQVAGLGSVLPEVSVARTANVCGPAATVKEMPDTQVANAAPSCEHWNVEPALVLVNENAAVVAFVKAAGLAVMVVSGTAESTVHVRVAAALTFPAASVATTDTV